MAIRVDTNALILAKVFKNEITINRMEGWAQGAFGNVIDGSYSGDWGFPYYVARYWLSGQAMNVSDDLNPTASLLRRGWHHRDTVMAYTPKKRKRGILETKIGMYSPTVPKYSLNYIAKNVKNGAYKNFMSKAWSRYKGSKKSKDELTWMFDKGLEKLFREENPDDR